MSILPRIGLSLAALALVLAIGEIAARLLAGGGPSGAPASRSDDLPELQGVFELSEPNLEGLHQGVYYRTNSYGIRGPELPVPAPDDVFRILVVGDSVTMGWGVREEDSYAHRVERRLAQEPPPGAASGRFEVLNLGLAGLNARFSVGRLQRLAEVYPPDLVVYGFTINDIEGPDYRELEDEEEGEAYRSLWRRALRFGDSPSYLLRAVWPRLVLLLEGDALGRAESDWAAPVAAELDDNYFDNPAAWADFEAALGELAGFAQQRGICAHMLIHTHLTELVPGRHPFSRIYEHVARVARARGIRVTPTFARFAGRQSRELWVSAFDVHPNADAHALLADALYDGLRTLPASCWQGSEVAYSRPSSAPPPEPSSVPSSPAPGSDGAASSPR